MRIDVDVAPCGTYLSGVPSRSILRAIPRLSEQWRRYRYRSVLV
jgi:hypothetical protein